MTIPSTEELLALIGFKEVEIYTLMQQIRSLQADLAALQAKAAPPIEEHDRPRDPSEN